MPECKIVYVVDEINNMQADIDHVISRTESARHSIRQLSSVAEDIVHGLCCCDIFLFFHSD